MIDVGIGTNVAVEGDEWSIGTGTWDRQTVAGLAALTEAATYVAGIVYLLVVPDYANVTGPLERVELFVENQASLYAMNRLVYVVFGIALVALVLALHH